MGWPAESAKIDANQVAILRAGLSSLESVSKTGTAEITQADALNNRDPLSISTLKGHLTHQVAAVKAVVLDTQDSFLKTSQSKILSTAAHTFFGSLLAEYAELFREIEVLQRSSYPSTRDRTLRALETTVLAYRTVATEESMTFNLEVESTPPQAAVSYRREGDSYTQSPYPTTTTLWNLPFAIYMIRVQKPKYVDQEKPHDPFREPNHKMHFDLVLK